MTLHAGKRWSGKCDNNENPSKINSWSSYFIIVGVFTWKQKNSSTVHFVFDLFIFSSWDYLCPFQETQNILRLKFVNMCQRSLSRTSLDVFTISKCDKIIILPQFRKLKEEFLNVSDFQCWNRQRMSPSWNVKRWYQFKERYFEDFVYL